MPDGAAAGPAPLSAALRQATAAAHAALEHAAFEHAGWAGRLASPAAYAAWLARHYAVFAPAEAQLARLGPWPLTGIDLPAHRRLPALAADLTALGIDPAAIAALAFPPPPTLAAGLGALYVLEGSALGGKIILREAQARLGDAIAGATGFFAAAGHPPWTLFKSRLDAYGAAHCHAQPAVIAGALAMFAAFAAAFTELSP